jgi:hypothetical protein
MEQRGSIEPVLMADFSMGKVNDIDADTQAALKNYRARNPYS